MSSRAVETITEGRRSIGARLTAYRLHPRELLPALLRVQREPLAVAMAVGLVTFLVQGYRVTVAPDVFSDEGIYLGVARNLANGAGLSLNNETFLWHPPLYMLMEAAYLELAGLANADPIEALLSTRYLNILFSALTASFLMLFGRRLHSYRAGLAAAALFLMDPYVQRINRRSMLETFAMLCVLVGFYIFFTRRQRLTRKQCLGAGVAFGLAMLTKEAMLLELVGLIGYVIWSKRSQLRDVVWVASIACVVYLPYPAWVVATGHGDRYLFYQLFGITRVLHSLPGYPRPAEGATPAAPATFSVSNLGDLLPQYEMSYLLILVAACFTIVLILRFRSLIAARYLITWSVVSFAICLPLGKTSDQYFYYLIVPSTMVAGYVLASLRRPASLRPSRRPRGVSSSDVVPYGFVWGPIVAAFAVMFTYNAYVWVTRYVRGHDDGYVNAIRYVEGHVPRGETLVTSNDAAYYFLVPSYDVRLDRNVRDIVNRCERYFVMSSKDAWARHNLMTPQLYDWVVKSSRPLFVQQGASFWTIGVYLRRTIPGGQACRFRAGVPTAAAAGSRGGG